MTNGRHRARQLAELVSDVQRYLARNRESPEVEDVRRALASLESARQAALASQADEEE